MRNPFASRNDTSQHRIPAPQPEQLEELEARGLPLSRLADCATCDDPCEGSDIYAKLDIDLDETPMLGSAKPYGRIVIASTGKSDWPHEVIEEKGTLACLLDEAYSKSEKASGHAKSAKKDGKEDHGVGVYPSSVQERRAGRALARKLSILNGSHLSPDSRTSSVFVLPDYKIVQGIRPDAASASALVASALAPETSALAESSAFQSWPLAYRAVVFVCSHKRRDKRCHVVAPFLIQALTHALEQAGLHIDERGVEAERGPESCLESWPEEGEAREARFERARRKAAESNTVGIFKVSHIGGHRYAGNLVICLPSGVNIWYGRVGPNECEAVVKETILGGRVIAELLRGGVGLEQKGGPGGVLAW